MSPITLIRLARAIMKLFSQGIRDTRRLAVAAADQEGAGFMNSNQAGIISLRAEVLSTEFRCFSETHFGNGKSSIAEKRKKRS